MESETSTFEHLEIMGLMKFNPGEIWWMVCIYAGAECGNEAQGSEGGMKVKVYRQSSFILGIGSV